MPDLDEVRQQTPAYYNYQNLIIYTNFKNEDENS